MDALGLIIFILFILVKVLGGKGQGLQDLKDKIPKEWQENWPQFPKEWDFEQDPSAKQIVLKRKNVVVKGQGEFEGTTGDEGMAGSEGLVGNEGMVGNVGLGKTPMASVTDRQPQRPPQKIQPPESPVAGPLTLNPDALVNAFIFSEVLQPPRCKRQRR